MQRVCGVAQKLVCKSRCAVRMNQHFEGSKRLEAALAEWRGKWTLDALVVLDAYGRL